MQHVVKGRGSLNAAAIAELMAKLSMQRPLLVCSERMQKDFAVRTGLELPLFSGYHPNPDLCDAAAGADMYRDKGCDGLISVGGGSAMDTAKAVKALLLAGDMEAVKASRLPEGEQLPHIAIPGTAGTGSEATPFAVVYVEDVKLSLDHPALLPDAVILDGALLDTLPLYHKKACAMDAISQAIEACWAKNTWRGQAYAERALRMIKGSIMPYLEGDDVCAQCMLEGAYEAGKAIALARTTAAHAMSYQITKRLGYAHGHACMLTLPYLWRRLAKNCETDGIFTLRLSLGLYHPDVLDGDELLLGLLAETDMLPAEMPDETTLDVLVASVNAQRLSNHPEPLTSDDLRAVYTQAFTPVPAEERARLAAIWREYAAKAHSRRGTVHPCGE